MARSRSPAGLSLRSTTVHNTVYPGLLYSKNLVGPNMVRALSETKIAAFEDHETLARSVDQGRDDAEAILHTLVRISRRRRPRPQWRVTRHRRRGRPTPHLPALPGSRSWSMDWRMDI